MSRLLWLLAVLAAVAATASAQTDELDEGLVSTSTSSVDSDDDLLSDGDGYLDSEDEGDAESDSDDIQDSSLESSSSSATTICTLESTYKNWVGPGLSAAVDTACYRESHAAKICAQGFERKAGICWAECPLEYPVECGLQCIRQNDDCTLDMVSKVSSIAQAALSLATFGLYGAFSKMAKGIQTAFKCGKEMANLVKSMAKYVRAVKVSDPQTTRDQIVTILYQTDNVVFDLPITILSCLGVKVADKAKFADRLTNTVELVVKEIATNQAAIVSNWTSFVSFMKNISLGDSFDSMNETDITSMQSALESNSTCGYNMKRLADRTWMTVEKLREKNPDISVDEIRVAMSKSSLVLYEIPTVTNNCMEQLIAESDEKTAYATRKSLRKALGGIVDDLISSGTSDNATHLTAEEYAYTVADKSLMFGAIWDVTNVAGVVSEFFQTICGPTEFIGEIDDGTAEDALGLSIVGKAFNHSAGNWTKIGDGTVEIIFQSVDDEDVTVNIMSGGNRIDKVEVNHGETVSWVSNVTTLGGKTLYLDRWHAGFLGIPGTGGGSLLLWVPRSTHGGHLQLTAMLNTS